MVNTESDRESSSHPEQGLLSLLSLDSCSALSPPAWTFFYQVAVFSPHFTSPHFSCPIKICYVHITPQFLLTLGHSHSVPPLSFRQENIGACARGEYKGRARISLVPRPHPLTRRNGLVNQVEFLGLAGALATV